MLKVISMVIDKDCWGGQGHRVKGGVFRSDVPVEIWSIICDEEKKTQPLQVWGWATGDCKPHCMGQREPVGLEVKVACSIWAQLSWRSLEMPFREMGTREVLGEKFVWGKMMVMTSVERILWKKFTEFVKKSRVCPHSESQSLSAVRKYGLCP